MAKTRELKILLGATDTNQTLESWNFNPQITLLIHDDIFSFSNHQRPKNVCRAPTFVHSKALTVRINLSLQRLKAISLSQSMTFLWSAPAIQSLSRDHQVEGVGEMIISVSLCFSKKKSPFRSCPLKPAESTSSGNFRPCLGLEIWIKAQQTNEQFIVMSSHF